MLEILVQTATGTSNLASTVISFTNNTVGGNSIVVICGNSSASAGDVSGVTDSQGNLYTKVFTTDNALIGDLEIWYTAGIIGGADTITVAYTTGVACAVIIREYYGTIYANMLDKQTSNTGNSNSLSSGNTASLVQNYELVIGAGLIPLADSFTVGAGYTNLVTLSGPSVVAIAAEDKLVTTGGVQSATFGANTTLQWVCGITTFFLGPTGTTTSTSSTSTSSTSSSISSTSSSISSTSTSSTSISISTSSTSSSTSISSTSTSLSSTSSSTSSTSSSTSSTSISSTSSSTSISSTSTSVSSTSTSSTSISSTSSSTSISSTSSSFSSTSSSISSTSSSVSSTSISSTSSSSSTSTTTYPPPYIEYEYSNQLSLPGTETESTENMNAMTAVQVGNVTTDDGDYFIQRGSKYVIQEYEQTHQNNTDTISFTWKGRTTESTLISPIVIQIYNVNSTTWETLDTITTLPADTDTIATVSKSINLSNYYNATNTVSFRVYQRVI